jgi:hypothetical protein
VYRVIGHQNPDIDILITSHGNEPTTCTFVVMAWLTTFITPDMQHALSTSKVVLQHGGAPKPSV